MRDDNNPLGDTFDRVSRQLTDLPGVTRTTPSTVVTTTTLGVTETWIIQTFRQRDVADATKPARDIIFLQNISAGGSMRVVIPPDAANVIARQRDSLATKNRRIGARQAVRTRAAKGIEPFKKKGTKP